MEEKIKKLEAAVGKNIEQWNVEDLGKFSLEENLELLQLLKEPAVITECLDRSRTNRDVADVLVPLYIKSLMSEAENAANDLLQKGEDKKITNDEVKAGALEMIKNKSFYYRLVGYLILISMFQDYDLSQHEVDIKTCIGNLKEVICTLTEKQLESCYTLIMELFELLFPLRSKYFEKYKTDILDDSDERLKTMLDAIHDFEEAIMVQLQNLVPEDADKEAILKELEQKTEEGDK